MINTNLKGKRKLFCEEYLKDNNATQAAIRAGYSKKTAGSQGQRLLKNVEIEEYVGLLKKDALERNKISVDELVGMLADMSTWEVSDLYNEYGKIKKLTDWPKGARMSLLTVPTTTSVNEIDEKSIKFIDRKGTIIELMKYHGAYRKDNEQKRNEASQVTVFQLPDNNRD